MAFRFGDAGVRQVASRDLDDEIHGRDLGESEGLGALDGTERSGRSTGTSAVVLTPARQPVILGETGSQPCWLGNVHPPWPPRVFTKYLSRFQNRGWRFGRPMTGRRMPNPTRRSVSGRLAGVALGVRQPKSLA